LFPERIRVGLFPDRITVAGRAIPCERGFGTEPWDGAVAALRGIEWKERSRVTVELSNHFVRYALVPWDRGLADPAEEEGYVRHHFAKIHGERARSWALRWSADSPHAPRLASAIDAPLLAAIKASFPAKGRARLVSVQPAFMAAANRARRSLASSGGWLVLAEPERACVALYAGGWRAVQNARGDWLTALEREWHRAAPPAPRLAFVIRNAGTEPELDRAASPNSAWSLRELPA
jgi:hypothetical protein